MAVDPDPCAEARRLREIRTAIATGDTVSAARWGEDEMRWYEADKGLLETLIKEADKACDLQEGRKSKRTRYAKRGIMLRY